MNLIGSQKSSRFAVSDRKLQSSSYRGRGYKGRGSEAGFSCPIIRFAPAMTTNNTSACEILNTVCTRLSPVPQKWLAFFLNLQQRHGGSERNRQSNGKRLNLKDVSSCQRDEISPMVKSWTAAALRNAG